MNGEDILQVRDLKVHFPIRKGVFARTVGFVKAVDGVSFDLKRGETLGIVGESGSGKSTIVRTLTGLVKPTGGSFDLAVKAGMVFQDPLGALNPRQTVRAMLEEALKAGGEKINLSEAAAALLEDVGMDVAAFDRYPHEFSGGQRQRLCIARSLAAHPELVILDEAVSALDLTIRSQILDLLGALKAKKRLSYLFITHDLGVVKHVADRLLVMRRGKIVERGETAAVLENPQAEYTRSLLSAALKI